MKVLQVSCEGLGNGGVQNVIMNICRNMPEIHFDILLFTNGVRYYDDEFKALGGNIFRIPKYEGANIFRSKLDYYIRFFRILKGTYKIIKKNGPYDAIHCHNDLESGICNLAAYLAGIKIRISHSHTNNNKFPKKNIIAFVYRKILQLLMNISSNYKLGCTRESFVSIFGENYLKKGKSHILPNPINLKRFRRCKNIRLQSGKINIVHVGRYNQNKNQLFIVEILPYLLKKYRNVRLQLIGSGEEYKKVLQNRIKALSIESNVEFLPADTNVRDILVDASLFIFPSVSEGFGIVLLEAQAMGIPCLVSNSVPKEVDCGLCKFLSLSERKEIWVSEAVNILEGNHNLKLDKEKMVSLDVKYYTKKMKCIYEENIYYQSV